jgi:hypothetical protein
MLLGRVLGGGSTNSQGYSLWGGGLGIMWLFGSGLNASRASESYTPIRCRVSLFLVDETAVMVSGFPAWVWMAYEPFSRRILELWLSWTRNSLQAENS